MSITKHAYTTLARSPRVLGRLLRMRLVTDSRAFTLVSYSEFHSIQRRKEILALMSAIREARSESLLEVGTYLGGTGLLLRRTLSGSQNFVSLDLTAEYNERRLRCAHGRPCTDFVTMDSHSDNAVEAVRAIAPTGFDALLIDGDHSYAGVREDTERFLPLARPGALVAFHDIQPLSDEDIARGKKYVGGVPIWWRQLTTVPEADFEAFVHGDSGLGIGLMRLPTEGARLSQLLGDICRLPRLDY